MNKEFFSNVNYAKNFLPAKCHRKLIYSLGYGVTLTLAFYLIFSFHTHPSDVLSY